jgi:hypothetical protein
MSLIVMVVVLIALGIGLYWLNYQATKIQPWVKTLVNVIVIAAIVLWILQATGVWSEVKSVQVPHV